MHDREALARDFRALGVRAGDVVMLHASVRAVGELAGGPDIIHLALSDALGPAGTLFMYASCPRYVDEVGRGDLTAEQEAEVLEKLPAFDPETARADRSNGALVEMLRTWPGTRVNAHPARFAVRGAHADRLLAGQPWDYAFGRGSLLERFVALDGRILLLGSDHDNVTFCTTRSTCSTCRGSAWRDSASRCSSGDGGPGARWPSSTPRTARIPRGRRISSRASSMPTSSTPVIAEAPWAMHGAT